LPQQEEAQKFIDAYEHCQPTNSIVCSSVASAIEGNFGNYHRPSTRGRTGGGTLFISPLMNMFWCFELTHVAECACIYCLCFFLDIILVNLTLCHSGALSARVEGNDIFVASAREDQAARFHQRPFDTQVRCNTSLRNGL
jgi:hypothetical protein